MQKKAGALLDRVLGTVISKKLTVFLMATVFLILYKIEPDQWVELCKWYIGGQSIVDGTKYYCQSRKVKLDDSDL